MHHLRVGVIGLGFAGETHTKAYLQVPDVEVVAAAGLEEDRLELFKANYGVRDTYRDWREMVARDDLNVISVCLPNNLHLPATVAALEGGKHVLCEKPLARSGEEAERMVGAAIAARRVLHVAFNHRQRGDVQTLKAYIDEGGLGRIYYAKAYWMRRQGIPGITSWFTSKEMAGGGPLIDLGVHVLDMALYLLGEPAVTTVSATTYAELGPRGRGSRKESGSQKFLSGDTTYEVEDLATAYMRTDGGATLQLEASWAVYGNWGDDYGIVLYGTEGGAEIAVKNYGWEDTLRIYNDVAGIPNVMAPRVGRGGYHQAVVSEFVEAIRGGDWSAHVGREGLRRARIIDACYASALEGREIVLDGGTKDV